MSSINDLNAFPLEFSEELGNLEDFFANQPATNTTELERLVEYLQTEAYNDSERALKAVNEAENILQQAYTGRYLFELIQNVRDANKAMGINGNAFIEVADGVLTISNTGAGFTKKGIRSITTIGDSTKDSKDFIGFKGIGFKSIQEISDAPKIITEFGTIAFDRRESFRALSKKIKDIKNIPLFFIPHFFPEKLREEELATDIVTKVVLPLREGEDETNIYKSFRFIKPHQLLLLGNIEFLEFRSSTNNAYFKITDDSRKGRVTLETEEGVSEYKRFTPSYQVEIPPEKLLGLTEKEKEIYQKDPFVDIVLLFDNEDKRLQPISNANLYLFNPLEIRSGFKFLIHSYFIVNAERTLLRDNLLNEFLLTSIADYLTGEWLKFAMRFHDTVYLDFLAFDRNRETKILNKLYDRVIENLKSKEFIYDPISNHRYRYHQVIIGDGFDKGLFENNRIGNQQIIYVKNKETVNWLTGEMGIDYLDNQKIREHLEKECERQRKKQSYKFFERLYKYMANTKGIDFSGLKILLTSENVLRSEKENVFYGLAEHKRKPLPSAIRKRIYFNHPEITIKKFREGNGTGFLEFKNDLLARQLLTLFDDPKVANKEILNCLLDLPFTDPLILLLRPRVFLPLKNGTWVKPTLKPVYLPLDELALLYPDQSFLDTAQINGFTFGRLELTSKLIALGAWNIPAIYFKDSRTIINNKDERFQRLLDIKWFTTTLMEMTGNYVLDLPNETNEWFSQTIIASWQNYLHFIQRPEHREIEFKSSGSTILRPIAKHQLLTVTDFCHQLRNEKWLHTGPGSLAYTVSEIIAIDNTEYNLPGSAHFKRYLKVFKLNYTANADFIRTVGINHLDGYGLDTWKNILSRIAKDYVALEVDNKDFTFFYHKVYGKLFEFFENRLGNKESIKELKSTKFLCINDLDQMLDWQPGSKIFNIDDKSGYDILPEKIKSVVQPQFTLKDKNRFGQISKLIGISFRKEITQRLEEGLIIAEKRLSDFIPYLSEAVALVETNVNGDFTKDLEKIRDTLVRVMDVITVQIYVRNDFVQTLDVPCKVETGKVNLLYSLNKPEVNTPVFLAGALHDFLVELLNRDLLKSKNLLLDFFSRENKSDFLLNYEVEDERVEAIREIFTGHQLNAEQRFWIDVLTIKNVNAPFDYIQDEQVMVAEIAQLFSLASDQLTTQLSLIDFNKISDPSAIQPLSILFNLLKVNLIAFNQIALLPIDFSEFYRVKFVNFLAQHRSAFEAHLYNFLQTKSISSQAQFQFLLRRYDALRLQISPPVLTFDLTQPYIKQVSGLLSGFKLSVRDLTNFPIIHIGELYRNNLSLLQKQLEEQSVSTLRLESFLDDGAQRSLLYFGQTDELFARFIKWLENIEQQDDGKGNDLPVEEPDDTEDVEIEDTNITKVDVPEKKGRDGGWTNGNRLDGGAPTPHQDRIGRAAEQFVYDKLRLTKKNVRWVSRNAARAGVNAEGSDEFGYDISYMDEKDQVHYVEVKGNSAHQKHFYISRFEISIAKNKKGFYHVYYVPFAMERSRRRIKNLGNIFLFAGTQDIFNNQKFTATYDILEIKFS